MINLGPVAIAKNGVIGKNNDLPWHIPEDLRHFKSITEGGIVIMGRKTFESILNKLGKPLPNRINVVITSKSHFQVPEGVLVYPSLSKAIEAQKNNATIFLIGGYGIFKEGLEYADRALVTHIDNAYEGDIYFPEIDWKKWQKIAEEKHQGFSFVEYQKIT